MLDRDKNIIVVGTALNEPLKFKIQIRKMLFIQRPFDITPEMVFVEHLDVTYKQVLAKKNPYKTLQNNFLLC